MSQEERRIAEIEAEMARTQKNKGTEKHLGRLRGELAALRARAAQRAAGPRRRERARGAPGGAVVRGGAASAADVRRAMREFGGGAEPGGPPGAAEALLVLCSEDAGAKLAFLRAAARGGAGGAGGGDRGGDQGGDRGGLGLASAAVAFFDRRTSLLLLFEGDDVRLGILELLARAPRPALGAPRAGDACAGAAGAPGRALGPAPGPTDPSADPSALPPPRASPSLVCALQVLKLDYCPAVQQSAAALLASWLEGLSVHERRRLLVREAVPALAEMLRLAFSPYAIPRALRAGNPSRADTTLDLARAMLLRSCAPFLALESSSAPAPETQGLKEALLSLYRAALGGPAGEGFCPAREILGLRGCLENALAIALLSREQEAEVAGVRAELDRREDAAREGGGEGGAEGSSERSAGGDAGGGAAPP